MSTTQFVGRFALAYLLLLAATVGILAALGSSPGSLNMLLAFAAAVAWAVRPIRQGKVAPVPPSSTLPVVAAVSLLGGLGMAAFMAYAFNVAGQGDLWQSLPYALLVSVLVQAVGAFLFISRSAADRGDGTPGRAGQ